MTTDLATMSYGDLVAALRKDLLLDLGTDALPNTFPVVSGLLKWTTPTLVNAWVNVAGFETAAYLKDPLGFVHLKGVIQGGTTGTVAFVLAAGFRPGAQTFNAAGGGGPSAAVAQITTNGNVSLAFGSPGIAIGMSGITFLAEN